MQLVIGNKNYSSWSLVAWLCLKQFGVPFEEIPVSLKADGLKERLGKFSPSCRVPVLIDPDNMDSDGNALTIWDSLAIGEYISDQYLDGKGWPQESALRAHSRAITCEMHAGFAAVRGELPMNCRATRKVELSATAHRGVARIDEMWSSLRQHHAERGPWLFGTFSLADCMYAPAVFRFKTYRASVSEASTQYMTTMLNNEHIQQWLADALKETEIVPEDEAGIEIEAD